MKKGLKKLVLHRTTLRRLDQQIGEEVLRGIQGGDDDVKLPPPDSIHRACEI